MKPHVYHTYVRMAYAHNMSDTTKSGHNVYLRDDLVEEAVGEDEKLSHVLNDLLEAYVDHGDWKLEDEKDYLSDNLRKIAGLLEQKADEFESSEVVIVQSKEVAEAEEEHE